jgi:hypothetical protein
MFRTDDMKKLEAPMHRGGEFTGKGQQVMIILRRSRYADETVDLWREECGILKGTRPNRQHWATGNAQDMLGS